MGLLERNQGWRTSFSTVKVIDRSLCRRDGSVVDKTLDYQSRDRKIIPRFSALWDETLYRGPVSVWPRCWWDVKPEFTHSLSGSLYKMSLLYSTTPNDFQKRSLEITAEPCSFGFAFHLLMQRCDIWFTPASIRAVWFIIVISHLVGGV